MTSKAFRAYKKDKKYFYDSFLLDADNNRLFINVYRPLENSNSGGYELIDSFIWAYDKGEDISEYTMKYNLW